MFRSPDTAPSVLRRKGWAACARPQGGTEVQGSPIYYIMLMSRCSAESFHSLKRAAAAGSDGVRWKDYQEGLEERLVDLHTRIHTGRYRAQPARRTTIPKADGSSRSLSIWCLEDKIVQQSITTVLSAVYEEDFLGFSYGFRQGRGQHDALDALTVGICRRKVNWILDADIQSFFDRIDHDWMMRFMEHRIGDKRLLRLVLKWLKVGVLDEEGNRVPSSRGAAQGAVISPLLANIYLALRAGSVES